MCVDNMAESANQGKDGKRKKKSKKYYGGGKKGKYERSIQAGMIGVLVFGADNEAKAKREAYNLLNEYADELFGAEILGHDASRDANKKLEKMPSKRLVVNYQHGDGEQIVGYEDMCCSEEDTDDNDVDIEKSILEEIKQIKGLKDSRRFQEIPTGVNCVLFIKTTLSKEDLNKLIHCILADIAKTKQNKARSFQRLVPITAICSADLKSINKTVMEHFLPDEDKERVKICVHYKSRFNSSLTRTDVQREIASIFLEVGHTVDLNSPDMVIVVEVMKGLCFMNILNDFFRFKRYNLHSIANDGKDTAKAKDSEKDTGKAENSEKDIAKAEDSEKDTGKAENSEKDTGKAENSEKDTGKAEDSEKHTAKAKDSEKDTGKAENSEKDTGKAEDSEKDTAKAKDSEKHTGKDENSKKDIAKAEDSEKDSALDSTNEVKDIVEAKDTAKDSVNIKDTVKDIAKVTSKESAKDNIKEKSEEKGKFCK